MVAYELSGMQMPGVDNPANPEEYKKWWNQCLPLTSGLRIRVDIWFESQARFVSHILSILPAIKCWKSQEHKLVTYQLPANSLRWNLKSRERLLQVLVHVNSGQCSWSHCRESHHSAGQQTRTWGLRFICHSKYVLRLSVMKAPQILNLDHWLIKLPVKTNYHQNGLGYKKSLDKKSRKKPSLSQAVTDLLASQLCSPRSCSILNPGLVEKLQRLSRM